VKGGGKGDDMRWVMILRGGVDILCLMFGYLSGRGMEYKGVLGIRLGWAGLGWVVVVGTGVGGGRVWVWTLEGEGRKKTQAPPLNQRQ